MGAIGNCRGNGGVVGVAAQRQWPGKTSKGRPMASPSDSIQYDSEADVLYVRLAPGGAVARTVELDVARLIDYSADGAVVGLEFLDASDGIDLTDVPFAHRAEQLIGESGLELPVFA